MAFTPTPHPVHRIPTAQEMLTLGERKWREVMAKREEMIRQEREDPIRHQWEPPIWRVCDAVLGFPWVEEEWAKRMRTHLQIPRPLDVLLINGGNRGGKSEYAANRTQRIMVQYERERGWCFHSKETTSVEEQQPLMWKFLPKEWRKTVKSDQAYIAFKHKTGFSDSSYVLPNLTRCTFQTYSIDVTTIEGINLVICWADELIPIEFVETLELRIAEKHGKMIITFTPVDGYTPTVKMFQYAADVVQESTAFLLPKDGGPPDIARALGGMPDEWMAELRRAHEDPKRSKPTCPASIAERCDEWLEGKTGQPEIPEGRKFQTVPRVMKCNKVSDPEGKRGVVFFHSSDNPFGNPYSVISTILGANEDKIKERYYGLASKAVSARCPKYNEQVHVIPADKIPRGGTIYQFVDPCSGRNFAMNWMMVHASGDYVKQEWPGNYDIPGEGVPGPWALPDGKKPDGKPGPAQRSFGWSLIQYKQEIARIEGWKEYGMERPKGMTDEDWIASWTNVDPKMKVEDRYMDSRYGNTPVTGKEQVTTLIEEFADINLHFLEMPAEPRILGEGLVMLNGRLSYDPEKPVDMNNRPRFYVCEDCYNTRFALQNWTGVDGQKGACKDFMDLLRAFCKLDLEVVEPGYWQTEGGGSW